MAPNLRLTLSDRPMLRFGRKHTIQDSEVDAHFLPLDLDRPALPPKARSSTQLPSISRLDTRSFENLFDSFQESETNKAVPHHSASLDTPTALQQSSGTTISPFDALHSHGNPATIATMPSAVARGDSTASSSSGDTHAGTLSHASKRSSRSSLALDLAIAGSAQKKPATGRWTSRNLFASASRPNNSSIPDVAPPTIKEGKGSTGRKRGLDKPLPPSPRFDMPPLPPIPKTGSREVASPKMDKISNAVSGHGRPFTSIRPATRRSMSTSVVDCTTLSSMMSGNPASPKSTRGARLGKAITYGGQFLHSRSCSTPRVDLDLTTERGCPNGSANPTKSPPRSYYAEESISADAAADIVFQIMYRLHSLRDLQSTAMLSRGFYTTFKRHECSLVGRILLRESPPSWEMMQLMTGSKRGISFNSYQKYQRTLESLRSTILVQCEATLKAETLAGLTGTNAKRRRDIDTALWRIWIFCERFGTAEKYQDVQAQVDWLNGGRAARKNDPATCYGRGNGQGLKICDLEDISEMWYCLGLLLQGFQHRIDEARLAGLFDKCVFDETRTPEWYLQEWVLYLQCRGLAVVTSVSSCSFDLANALDLTTWTAPMSRLETRSAFLSAAVTAAYQERMVAEATLKAAQTSLPKRAFHRQSKSDGTFTASPKMLQELQMIHMATTQKASRQHMTVKRKPVAAGSELQLPATSSKADALSPIETSTLPLIPTTNSSMLHSLSMTPTASTRLGATLFPIEYLTNRQSQIPVLPTSQSPVPPNLESHTWNSPVPEIIDPVDKAMALLVNDMGFAAVDAKRALAKCDTGFGMDVDKAITMLASESGRKLEKPLPSSVSVGLGPPSVLKAETILRDSNETCTTCGCSSPTLTQQPPQQPPHHRPGKSQDSLDSVLAPSSSGDEDEAGDSLSTLFLASCDSSALKHLGRTTSKAKAYKVLGVDAKSNPTRKRSVKAPRILGLTPRVDSIRQRGHLIKMVGRGMGTIKMPSIAFSMAGRGMVKEKETEGIKENKPDASVLVEE